MTMTFDDVKAEVVVLRKKGCVCTDAWLSADGKRAGYTLEPDDDTGYKVEYDLQTGDFYHCGNGQGCFWVCDSAETEDESGTKEGKMRVYIGYTLYGRHLEAKYIVATDGKSVAVCNIAGYGMPELSCDHIDEYVVEKPFDIIRQAGLYEHYGVYDADTGESITPHRVERADVPALCDISFYLADFEVDIRKMWKKEG